MKEEAQRSQNFRIVPAGEFKAQCLQLMDDVFADPRLSILITKRGKPVAQLIGVPPGLSLTPPGVQLHAEAAPALLSRSEISAEAATGRRRDKKRKDKKKKKS